jgi:zinc protease
MDFFPYKLRMITILSAAVTLATSAISPAFAVEPAAAAHAEPQRFVLDNGLELVAIPDRRAPVVTHMVWYRVGAADEPKGKSGIAHFLEHLMFKGTKDAPAGAFSAKVAAIGGRENAFTASDYTGYYQKVTPEALEMVMRYEADRMQNLVLDEDSVLPERSVVLEERRQRIESNPSAILSEAMSAALYRNHPYGTPIIGWEHEIASLTRADAMAFYERHYRPSNAIVVVAGDVSADEVLRMAERIYGVIQNDQRARPRLRPAEPEHVAELSVTYSDARVTTPSLRRTYSVPSYNTGGEGEAEALDLIAVILGGSSGSRIKRDMLVDEPIAASAGAWYGGGAYDLAELSVYVTPLSGRSLTEIEARLDTLIERLIADGVTEKELEDAKQYLVKSTLFERDSQSDMARLYGSVLATGGEMDDIDEWPERIRNVTLDQVNSAARNYLDPKRSVTGYLRTKET